MAPIWGEVEDEGWGEGGAGEDRSGAEEEVGEVGRGRIGCEGGREVMKSGC